MTRQFCKDSVIKFVAYFIVHIINIIIFYFLIFDKYDVIEF